VGTIDRLLWQLDCEAAVGGTFKVSTANRDRKALPGFLSRLRVALEVFIALCFRSMHAKPQRYSNPLFTVG
jgi:hypothetical protein